MPPFAFDTPVQAALGAELIARLSPEVAARKKHAWINIVSSSELGAIIEYEEFLMYRFKHSICRKASVA